MNLKKWLFLFATTSLLGGLTAVLTAYLIRYEGFYVGGPSFNQYVTLTFFIFILGILFSIISQMGFFAYLTIHRFGLGLFKSSKLWNKVQVVLIAFTFFDLVYLRYISFGQAGESWMSYLLLPSLLLVIALLAAYLKAKGTHPSTFIPALFFVFVVTVVEAVPALVQNDSQWILLMLIPLLVCNVWQLLILHRLTSQEKSKPSA